MTEQQFDVFMCHNSEDKAAVIKIAEQLRRRGLKPWLDVWELQPGAIGQFALEQQIESIGAVAVFAGQNGMGPWQSEEIYAFLQEFIRRRCPVIPVMLPETQTQPQLPIFLRSRHWVDFRLQNPDPSSQLIWGITGKRPDNSAVTAEAVLIQEVAQFPSIKEPALDARYADLERYLKNAQWEEADDETHRLMINMVGRREGEFFSPKDLLNFPCEPLETIDRLWVRYSNGRFGFSVQRDMYVKCGGLLDGEYDNEAYEKFCNSNGWKEDGGWSEMTFNTESPKGHLPIKMDLIRRRNQRITYRFNRIQTCKL